VTLEPEVPTQQTADILYYAQQAVEKLFSKGFQYKRGGVVLHELTSDSMVQETLFTTGAPAPQPLPAVRASEGRWQQRAEHLSPRYTTNVDEIALVL